MSELSTRPPATLHTWVTTRCDHGSWEVTVEGELDLASSDVLREAVAAAGTASRVVFDARGVTFLDCGGLRALLGATGGDGAELWLRSPSPTVRRFAHLAGLQHRWPGICTDDEVRIA